jgi:DNA invertase Pin-like site-specific DNA recombinase
MMPLVGYASPNPQQDDHQERALRRQTATIAADCERRGLALLETVREREPQRATAAKRPGLGRALQRTLDGEAQGVAVADLARLADSASELGRVLEWFLRSDVRLVAASPSLDTQDEAGRLAVQTIVELSRWEHERLAERTRMGMRAAQRKGPPRVADQPDLRERIARMRADGMTLQGIADRLNAEGVPTVRGGAKWRPSSVQTAAGYRRRSTRTRGANNTRTARCDT